MATYYQILGVSSGADIDVISKSFRKLALKYHPDVSSHAGAVREFQRINQAYQVLKDPDKRRLYDLQLIQGTVQPQPVYYRPAGQPAYRAPGDKYAHYRSKSAAKSNTSFLDALAENIMIIFLTGSGIAGLYMGYYRWLVEPDDNISPYSGFIMGTIFLSVAGWYLYSWRKHSFRRKK